MTQRQHVATLDVFDTIDIAHRIASGKRISRRIEKLDLEIEAALQCLCGKALARDRLANEQVSELGVGARVEERGEHLLLRTLDDTLRYAGLDRHAILVGDRAEEAALVGIELGHHVAAADGQALDDHRLVMMKQQHITAAQRAGAVGAVEGIGCRQGIPLLVEELDLEMIGFEIIRLRKSLSRDGLANHELAIVDHDPTSIGHDDRVDEAEEARDVQIAQIVGICIRIIGVGRVIVRMEVLLDARTQKALVGDEEGLVVRTAVSIGKTVVDDRVLAIVEVHLAHDGLAIRPLKGVVDPTSQRKAARRLRLGKRGDIAQGDVHLAVGGVLNHGLGQFADTCHDAYVIIGSARIGIDGVDADLDRNDRGIEFVAGRRRNLPQEVCRRMLLGKVAEGPGHVRVAGK